MSWWMPLRITFVLFSHLHGVFAEKLITTWIDLSSGNNGYRLMISKDARI